MGFKEAFQKMLGINGRRLWGSVARKGVTLGMFTSGGTVWGNLGGSPASHVWMARAPPSVMGENNKGHHTPAS